MTTRTEIDLTDGIDLATMIAQVWRHLAAANDPPHLFTYKGTIVRPTAYYINWLALQKLNAAMLRLEVAHVVDFFKMVGKDDPIRKALPPPGALISSMLATPPEDIPLPAAELDAYGCIKQVERTGEAA